MTLDFAEALLEQRDTVSRSLERLRHLCDTVARPSDLDFPQWVQLYALGVQYAPELVLEVGRGYGSTTCVSAELATSVGRTKVISVDNDDAEAWRTETLPRLGAAVPESWSDLVDARHTDPMSVDFDKLLSPFKRVLLLWNSHLPDLATHILGTCLRVLEDKEHLVVFMGVTDARFNDVAPDYVASRPLTWMGHLVSPSEDLVAVYDFLSRNRLTFQTPAESCSRRLKAYPSDLKALEKVFGEELAATLTSSGHWMYFDLQKTLTYFDLQQVIASRRANVYPVPSVSHRLAGDRRQMDEIQHHEVFTRFECWQGDVEPGFAPNFLGVMTRGTFSPLLTACDKMTYVSTTYPAFDEEYFEWVDVLEAVTRARRQFTMIELGAGWGRWLVNAAIAVEQFSGIPCRLIGLEAEPAHYEWMKLHFKHNGLNPRQFQLIRAAVAADDGHVWFRVGHAADWYGQSVASRYAPPIRSSGVWKLLSRITAAVPKRGHDPEGPLVRVRALGLRTLIGPIDRVDLLDLDIQGTELEVLRAAAPEIDRAVRRVHIGTHSAENEAGLRKLFGTLGWTSLNDYPCASVSQTPWGSIAFQDGVQTWINPKV